MAHDDMTSAEDDGIEILSCHIENDDDVIEQTTSVNVSVTNAKLPEDPQRKRVARAVAVVSFILLLFSVVLIGVSLNMSKNIDDLDVRAIDILDTTEESTLTPVSSKEGQREKYELCTRMARNGITTTEDDGIEILSCHIENDDDVIEQTTTLNVSVTNAKLPDDPQRKRVARAVAVVSFILLLFSVVLIGVSLNMSKNIDDLVRESNEVLREHYNKQEKAAAARNATTHTG